MRGGQVEVVAGRHAVARIGEAIVVVAHRESAPLTTGSVAAVALDSLRDLVTDAVRQRPEGPGAIIAREATRWLMTSADRISPGVPVDFGILSGAEHGGVAIFLHGAVTATVDGDGRSELFRGRDAAFTVDRVVALPARATALHADDPLDHLPELPATRGIGDLVEGVAQAGGVVVWSAAAGARPVASEVDRIPLPTARIDPEPRADAPRPRLEPEPTATSRAVPTSMMDAVPLADAEPEAPVPDAAMADTALEGMTHTAVGGAGDPHGAITQLGGTNPAPRPDPDLQRRLEATARATALTVKVLGFKCARAHPTDPRSAFCTVCGMPVDQTQALIEVVRPPLGMLVLDDGMTYMLAADAVIGRDPELSDAVQRGLIPLRINDSSGGMSRAHAEIHLVNWDVTVVDRGSTNGTRTRLPGYRDWIRLTPNQPMILVQGTEVMIGNRVLRFEPAAPPPFG